MKLGQVCMGGDTVTPCWKPKKFPWEVQNEPLAVPCRAFDGVVESGYRVDSLVDRCYDI